VIMTCSLHRLAGPRFALAVTTGDQEIAREHFATAQDALANASVLCREFISEGWTETYKRASGQH
jgi:hypothetical protein